MRVSARRGVLLALAAIALSALALWAWGRREPPSIYNVSARAGVGFIEVDFEVKGGRGLEVQVTAEPIWGGGEPVSARLAGEGRHSVRLEVKGGAGYRVVVSCKAGGLSVNASVVVPYVWEFEDLASKLAERGIVVSAVYVPWNMSAVLGRGWRGDVPLLGFYDALDERVQWRHVDWARGHGVSVFWVDWTLYAHTSARDRVVAVTRGLLEKGVKVGVMLGPQVDMHFGEGYPSVNLGDPWNRQVLLELAQLAAQFMRHPNYYRVGGRPALMIWNEAAFYNRSEAYRELRELIRRVCGEEPYIIADALPRIVRGGPVLPGTPAGEWYVRSILLRGDGGDEYVDAYTSWVGFLSVQGELALTREEVERYPQLYEEHLAAWGAFALSRGKCIVPTVSPGFDRTHDPAFGQPMPIPRSAERFALTLKAALAAASATGCGEVRVDTWNDFYEATFIEPSEGDGFRYLSLLKSALSP